MQIHHKVNRQSPNYIVVFNFAVWHNRYNHSDKTNLKLTQNLNFVGEQSKSNPSKNCR